MSDTPITAPIPRIALSASEVAAAIGISERLFRSWREAGRVPEPDIEIGTVKRWKVSTIAQWKPNQTRPVPHRAAG